MEFNKGDRVKVNMQYGTYAGKAGTVRSAYPDGGAFAVVLEDGKELWFFTCELELLDEKREALIELAETLDKARLQANAIDIPVIESQRGVYGSIVLALHDTLEQIVEDTDDPSLDADKVYVRMFANGNTVREALALVVG